MVKIISILLIFLLVIYTQIFSQSDPAVDTSQTVSKEPENIDELKEKALKKVEQVTFSGLSGFAEINWGTKYQDVKERFRILAQNQTINAPINIIKDSFGESILVRRGGILYKFLFYWSKKPNTKNSFNILNRKNDENQNIQMAQAARFFFVSSNFPFVPSKKLYNKLQKKYGKHTFSGGDEKRGAYIWDVENGFIVQWVESYKNKPYSRNVHYVSKEIREEIMQNLELYQNYKELQVIEKLIP